MNDHHETPSAHSVRDSEPGSPLAPVGDAERLVPVDALRGFAVLGIFMMNIVLFAYPFSAMMNPMSEGAARYTGELTGLNFAVWLFQHMFFDQKMMAIFSMLFGAGLVLMAGRAGGRKSGFGWIYYRRMKWLLIMGLLHAYLFWYGDILTFYAICGLLLYPLRNLRPRTLMGIGLPLFLVPVVLFAATGLFLNYASKRAEVAQAAIAAGETPDHFDSEMLVAWERTRDDFDPSPEQIDREIAAFRGTPAEVVAANAKLAAVMQLQMFLMWGLWRVLALMLLGMALMKLGIFSAARSPRYYIGMMTLGYGLGLPIVALGAWDQISSAFDPIRLMLVGWHYNYIASVAVALGHVGLAMLIYQSGVASGLMMRLAAVGRLALTNYLAQTLIGTSFFFGWGLGFFASLERPWLMVFVASVWALQLAWSPWWLARFRYGPAEWLWRTLTYFRVQPLRHPSQGSSRS